MSVMSPRKLGNGLGAMRKQFQFIEDSGSVTLQDVKYFLLQEIEAAHLRPLVDRQVITRIEAVHLLMAKLQAWLAHHGIDDSGSRKYLEHPETIRSFKMFLFRDDY